jgi:hypothetical protein
MRHGYFSITDSYLMLPNIYVVHIQERNDITVLIVVQRNTNLVEKQLNVEAWSLLVQLVIDSDLSRPVRLFKGSDPCNLPSLLLTQALV